MHHGHHDTTFLIFSLLVAIFGSWTALDLQRQVRSHTGSIKMYWLAASAVAAGLAIWAMHFLAMLGFDAGLPISYDTPTTAVSLLLAVGGTSFAFLSVQASKPTTAKIAIAGVIMGLAIVGMHYTGMAAMRVPATVTYDLGLVLASVAIGILVSWAALATSLKSPGLGIRISGAVILGLAIASMHHTAMAAVSFIPTDGSVPAQMGIEKTALALWVGGGTFLLLFLALLSAMFDRRFETMSLREAQAVAANEAHLKAILFQIPIGIAVVNDDREILFTNPPADLILEGRHPQALPLADIDGTPLEGTENPLRAAIVLGNRIDRQTVRLRRGDKDAYLEISAGRMPDMTGGESETILMMQDVTAKIEAEQTLQQAQKLETIGQLTGGVAHDFNNLLTPIVGGLDMLRRQPDNSPKAQRVIEGAIQASQKAATLVQRLLAFARRQALQARPVDLSQLLPGLSDLIKRTIGPTIKVDIRADAASSIHVDPGQLELAILNLAVNARDAMPDGGKLAIHAEKIDLADCQFDHLPAGRYVRIRVSDTGMGMDDGVRRRAIEPFFSTKGVGKGTGLGLSMAHGLAAQSQGGLAIDSAPGKGTRIDLVFPLLDAVPEAEARIECEGATPSGKARIILVDDEELVRNATAAMLEDLGYEVQQAASGPHALSLLSSSPDTDLIVTDYLMPGMTGAALASDIKSKGMKTPVLVITGYAVPSELPPELPRLSKPFNQDQIGRAVADILSGVDNVIWLGPRVGSRA